MLIVKGLFCVKRGQNTYCVFSVEVLICEYFECIGNTFKSGNNSISSYPSRVPNPLILKLWWWPLLLLGWQGIRRGV